LIQNLITQNGEFDIYIADGGDDGITLVDNVYIYGGLMQLFYGGHEWYIEKVGGTSQLSGDQAGLIFARDRGYEYGFICDDDLIFDLGFIEKGFDYIINHPNCGTLVGYTFIPNFSIEAQTSPLEMLDHVEASGLIKYEEECNEWGIGIGYQNCIYRNPSLKEPKEFEMVSGAYFFRIADFLKVGGFPQYMSRWGARGEMMTMVAVQFLGKKTMLHPELYSWHYSYPVGGLRITQEEKKNGVKDCSLRGAGNGAVEDMATWKAFIKRGTPDTSDPRVLE
jgi:hypothetical protein